MENNDAILRRSDRSILAVFLLCGAGLVACRNTPPLDCTLETEDYEQSTYAEPNRPSGTPSDPSIEDETFTSQYSFPRAANAGQGARTYWLTGDEEVSVTGTFALGEDAARQYAGFTITGSFLVSGAQAPFVLNAEPAALTQQFVVPDREGTFTHRFTVSGDVIPDGASNASLVYLTPDGNLFGSWDFTIIKNSGAFPEKSAITTELDRTQGGERVIDLDSGQPLDQAYYVNQTSNLRLRIPVKSAWSGCADLTRPYAIAALVDGIVHALTEAVAVPHVDVGGNTTAFFEGNLTDLPFDGQPHNLAIIQIEDGAYWETPLGTLSPLPDPTQVLGRGSW